jgi:hypothetical protein
MLDWQILIVGVLVALAVIYLGRQTLRTWLGKATGCGSGCGKCSSTTSPESKTDTWIPIEQITVRRR